MTTGPEPIDSPHRGTKVILDGCGAEVTILDGPDPSNIYTIRYADGSLDYECGRDFRDWPPSNAHDPL